MKVERIESVYLIWFFLPVVIFFCLVASLSVFFEPISGDLTRIGFYSERDFGWTQRQLDFPNQSGLTEANNPDILVLGDSFSHPNIWQSYLAKESRLKILTFQYQDVGCIDNWVKWISDRPYSKTQRVIIEVAERSFIPVFKKEIVCAKQAPKSVVSKKGPVALEREHFGLTFNSNYLLRTAWNTLTEPSSASKITSGEVINVPLNSDGLFSNRKNSRLLFYADDENKINWTDSDVLMAISNLNKVQDAITKLNLKFLLVVVPDKSSAYQNFIKQEFAFKGHPSIFNILRDGNVNNVNLLPVFQKAVSEIIDFYLPNDTHLSNRGYQVFASEIKDTLEKK